MKINKIGFGFLLSLMWVFSACVDFVEPNIPYKTFNTGLYLRTISGGTGQSFNFFNLSSGKFSVEVEAVDGEEGETLETVEFFVRHRRLIPGVGFTFKPTGTTSQVNQVAIGTLTKDKFVKATENPNHPTTRYLRGKYEITLSAILNALSMSIGDVGAGDAFEIRLKAKDKFGRVFDDTNRSADVQGGFFYRSPFRYDVPVVCPSDLAGKYRSVNVGATGPDGSCSGPVETEITLTRVGTTTSYTISDASFGYWSCIGDTWGNGNVRLNDSCGNLSLSGLDKYSLSYSMVFKSVSPQELVFVWKNAYGESGTVTLYSNPGKPWPDNLK
jgi:hypothetical protein